MRKRAQQKGPTPQSHTACEGHQPAPCSRGLTPGDCISPAALLSGFREQEASRQVAAPLGRGRSVEMSQGCSREPTTCSPCPSSAFSDVTLELGTSHGGSSHPTEVTRHRRSRLLATDTCCQAFTNARQPQHPLPHASLVSPYPALTL